MIPEHLGDISKHRPLTRGLLAVMGDSATTGRDRGQALGTAAGGSFLFERSWKWDALGAGARMETTAELINAINAEVEESKARLGQLYNEVRQIADIVNPALAKQAESIRTARMTVISEVNQSLTAMKDIRKFFLDSNYEQEMSRLERFVRLCREIQALKADGVFDAVCDASIRLAVKEESNEG